MKHSHSQCPSPGFNHRSGSSSNTLIAPSSPLSKNGVPRPSPHHDPPRHAPRAPRDRRGRIRLLLRHGPHKIPQPGRRGALPALPARLRAARAQADARPAEPDLRSRHRRGDDQININNQQPRDRSKEKDRCKDRDASPHHRRLHPAAATRRRRGRASPDQEPQSGVAGLAVAAKLAGRGMVGGGRRGQVSVGVGVERVCAVGGPGARCVLDAVRGAEKQVVRAELRGEEGVSGAGGGEEVDSGGCGEGAGRGRRRRLGEYSPGRAVV